jgi:hypothetical protein
MKRWRLCAPNPNPNPKHADDEGRLLLDALFLSLLLQTRHMNNTMSHDIHHRTCMLCTHTYIM